MFTSSKQCRINKFDQISRLCRAGRGGGGWGKGSKEIYQTRAARTKFVVWLIKPIAFWRSRCLRNRRCYSSPDLSINYVYGCESEYVQSINACESEYPKCNKSGKVSSDVALGLSTHLYSGHTHEMSDVTLKWRWKSFCVKLHAVVERIKMYECLANTKPILSKRKRWALFW